VPEVYEEPEYDSDDSFPGNCGQSYHDKQMKAYYCGSDDDAVHSPADSQDEDWSE
jgi:hypothetical protein